MRGVIEAVVEKEKTEVLVSFRKGKAAVVEPYYVEELSYFLEPAYATTVHKAQGGRAANVVFVFTTNLSNRSLLYTALTRCGSNEGTVTIITTEQFKEAPYTSPDWAKKVLEEEDAGDEEDAVPCVLTALYHEAKRCIESDHRHDEAVLAGRIAAWGSF